MTLPDQIKHLRELEAKATPGPWDDKPASLEWLANREANGELCRETRNALPGILDEIERLQEFEWKYKELCK